MCFAKFFSKIYQINRLIEVKDEEVKKLKAEISLMSGNWKHKTNELKSHVNPN
ncbi:hypothetical protein YC2023_006495 [Brassica napus]